MMKFDMMRVRIDGRVVPRHGAGQLRILRGYFYIGDEFVPEFRRSSRVATFKCDGDFERQTHGELVKLYDVFPVCANPTMLTFTGMERSDRNGIPIDVAQSWVLIQCEGVEPRAPIGPDFTR